MHCFRKTLMYMHILYSPRSLNETKKAIELNLSGRTFYQIGIFILAKKNGGLA